MQIQSKMKINVEKLKHQLARNRGTSKVKSIEPLPVNMSKEKTMTWSKKQLNIYKDAEQENQKPGFLNSNENLLVSFLQTPASQSNIENLKTSLIKQKSSTLILSKNTLLKVIDKINAQKDSLEESVSVKKSIKLLEKNNVLNENYLMKMKTLALKNLVNENFDEVMRDSEKTRSEFDKVGETIRKLFQKEILFEQSLNLLADDDVDINQLLFCAFEKIQSDNYSIPTGQSRSPPDGFTRWVD